MKKKNNQKIIKELTVAYWMEIETLLNYLSNSNNLEGVRAEEIKNALNVDIPVELGHAQSLAKRIRTLGGEVPGSMSFEACQKSLQPTEDSTDVAGVIRGVIDAEEAAIDQYNKIIKLCEGSDYPTQDLVIGILSDEEDHRREFMGFLKEYER